MVSLGTMERRSALHIRMFATISHKLKETLEEHLDVPSDLLPFKESYAFLQRLKPWHPSFSKPPLVLLRNCQLDALALFYRERLSLDLFQALPAHTQSLIESEISYHVARTAMDTFMGVRLRNLAQIGIQRAEWPCFRDMVQVYFEETVPLERREQLREAQRKVSDRLGEDESKTHVRLGPQLFHDVDRLRLMSHGQFKNHIASLLQRGRASGSRHTEDDIPNDVAQSLEWLDLPVRIGPETLKQRYRELALLYHPDKGGTREQMQMLNTAYEVVRDFVGKSEMGQTSAVDARN